MIIDICINKIKLKLLKQLIDLILTIFYLIKNNFFYSYFFLFQSTEKWVMHVILVRFVKMKSKQKLERIP